MTVYTMLKRYPEDFQRLKERFPDIVFFSKVVKVVKWNPAFGSEAVLGVASLISRVVSFREATPAFTTILHELGHVYFKVKDDCWNDGQGSGSLLLELAVYSDRYKITTSNIEKYISLASLAIKNPECCHRYITDKIASKKVFSHLNLYHLYHIAKHAEIRIEGLYPPEIDWKTSRVKTKHLQRFLKGVVEGLKYHNSVCIAYAQWLGFINQFKNA